MRHFNRNVGLGILGVALMTAGASRALSAEAASPEKTAGAAMLKGLDWLKPLQRPDGSWSVSNYPAMTALGLWAFTRSDHPDRASICSNAAAFVARFAQPDGGIYKPATEGRGSGGLSTYNTAICMLALHAYDKRAYAPVILAARTYLAGCQIEGDSSSAGGFGYNRPPARSGAAPLPRDARADLSNTGWALQAMRVTQDLEDQRPKGASAADVNWAAVRTFLDKLQNKDEADPDSVGGFSYESSGERGGTSTNREGVVRLRGYGSMNYAGLESMIYAQLTLDDPKVKSALHWASRHWSVDENPGMGGQGLYYYYTIMGKALGLTGNGTFRNAAGEVIPWKQQLADKLAGLQKPDGSWVNDNGMFWESDPVLATAYSVLTLETVTGR